MTSLLLALAVVLLASLLAGLVRVAIGPTAADRMLAALRDYAGPGPQLAAIILDFAGQQLWRGESQGEMQDMLVGIAHPTS